MKHQQRRFSVALLMSAPAATYSPTQLPGQHHRRWRAYRGSRFR